VLADVRERPEAIHLQFEDEVIVIEDARQFRWLSLRLQNGPESHIFLRAESRCGGRAGGRDNADHEPALLA
jgi:hypothetical protein